MFHVLGARAAPTRGDESDRELALNISNESGPDRYYYGVTIVKMEGDPYSEVAVTLAYEGYEEVTEDRGDELFASSKPYLDHDEIMERR